jgi:hypothetical protein
MKDISLTQLVRDVKRTQKKTLVNVQKKALSLLTVERILKSNFLTYEENLAVAKFLHHRGKSFKLNENTIALVQKEMLQEDFWSSISTGTKNALSSGWDSIKKVWSNFKVFVQSFIDQMKAGFDKLLKWMLDRISKSLAWIDKVSTTISTQPVKAKEVLKKVGETLHAEKAEDLHANLRSDTSHFLEAGSYLYNFINSKIINGELWSKSVLNAQENSASDESTINEVFTDKEVLSSLYSLNESGLAHPEDLLVKHPSLNKVVKICLLSMKYSFGIFTTLVGYIVKEASKKFFTIISYMSKKTGGPGVYEFAILSLFCSELFEIAGHHIQEIHHGLDAILNAAIGSIKAFFPLAVGHIEIAEVIIRLVATFFYFYAVAVSIVNVLVPAIKGALPEVFNRKASV